MLIFSTALYKIPMWRTLTYLSTTMKHFYNFPIHLCISHWYLMLKHIRYFDPVFNITYIGYQILNTTYIGFQYSIYSYPTFWLPTWVPLLLKLNLIASISKKRLQILHYILHSQINFSNTLNILVNQIYQHIWIH